MIVYKYQKIDQWFYKNLENLQIYCNSPENFNDPFDCQIEFQYLDDLLNIIGSKRDLNKIIKESEGNNLRLMEFIKSEFLEKLFVENMIEYLEREAKKLFISSFSKHYTNELLWAHYAENHKGICICYDMHDVKKVRYDEDYPRLSVNFMEKLLNIKNEGIQSASKYTEELIMEFSEKAFLTKSDSWFYEEEYRLIEKKKILILNKNQIKALYFGLRTSDEDKKAILQILKDKEIKIPIYQMEKVKGKFLFEPKLIKE